MQLSTLFFLPLVALATLSSAAPVDYPENCLNLGCTVAPYKPICAFDGKTVKSYDNSCIFAFETCSNPKVARILRSDGECTAEDLKYVPRNSTTTSTKA
ncbi:hypothetical protein HDV05_007467 [Chytridiales sp. JEL 0842]|nr:hypothetical protein HDV05_007467 [Chytridiales sp. JEL 0842]